MLLNDDNFEMQGGVRNYLGETQEVTAPKYWKSSKDSPSTELAYITEAEKGLLLDANLHGSLKDGKPNVGASGLLSYDGWGSTDPGQNRAGGDVSNTMDRGGNDGNDRMGASSGSSNFVGDIQGSTYDEAGTGVTDVDAEDEYLEPDNDHFKATQKAIGKTNEELRELGLDKSDWSDWTKEEQDTYQAEMNKLNGTEGKNYSFYKGNKGTTNLTFGEHWKDTVVTNPVLKFSPFMRLLVAAGRTIKENATTDYGTGKYGGYTADGMGSGQPIDQGGWLGRVFNSDGSVNENLTENEANDIYNQIQPDLPFIIGDTEKPDSMVNDYFNNLNNTNLGINDNFLNTYNTAKTKMANTLNMTPPNQQFGYGNTYNDTYSRKMNNTNVFYNYLNEQGLI